MGGGKNNKYANRKKNKIERKEKEVGPSSAEKSLDSIKDSSQCDDVEMRSEVTSTDESSWTVDEAPGKSNDRQDFKDKKLPKMPEEREHLRKEKQIVKSEVREDNDSDKFQKIVRKGSKDNMPKIQEHQTKEKGMRRSEARNSNNFSSMSTEENEKARKGRSGEREQSREGRKGKTRWSNDDSYENIMPTQSYRDSNITSSGNQRGQQSNLGQYFRQSTPCDKEFIEWDKYFKGVNNEKETNVIEVFGDLFCVDDSYALGHCVAEDMNMGSGIATEFRSKFKSVAELLDQGIRQGGVATLFIDNRFIYYLVTKRSSNGKPTYVTLFKALRKMKEHAEKNGVKKIAMPRIGCGLDRLEWVDVKSMLEFIFKDVDVEIKIFHFQQEYQPIPTQPPKRKCPVKNVLKPVVKIEDGAIIIYPCSKDQKITKTMEDLDEKFNIQADYSKSSRELGSVIRTDPRSQYILYGIVVKERVDDPINFSLFQKCINEINKRNNQKDMYYYVAMEAFKDNQDIMVITKLVNLMRNTFYYEVSVYICWPEELEYLAPRELEYS